MAKPVDGGIYLDDNEILTVGMLKELLKNIADETQIIVRTDYYYENPFKAVYEEDFTEEGPDMRGSAFVIEG